MTMEIFIINDRHVKYFIASTLWAKPCARLGLPGSVRYGWIINNKTGKFNE